MQSQKFRIRRIDVERWGSPVASQYGIRVLPTWWLYEGTTLISKDKRDILERLDLRF